MREEWIPSIFPSAGDDVKAAELDTSTPQTLSPSYRLAFRDYDLLLKDELRPVRLLLELQKPELILNDHGIAHTVVIFGGSRLRDESSAQAIVTTAETAAKADPTNTQLARELTAAHRLLANAKYYEEARKLAGMISCANKEVNGLHCVVATGGGPGIMEAANRGAQEAGAESIGYNIVLPFEQHPNQYITPELCFLFHYFAIRKMHFLMRARVLIVFPGGFGTLDELFEALTLIQTHKITPIPILIFGKSYWERLINFQVLVDEGMILQDDLTLFHYVETAEVAWDIISNTIPASACARTR